MSSDREIITIQLGTASNFVGTHWWNIQESSFIFDQKKAALDETRIKHDVLFREGRNVHNKMTFTPRLVTVDFTDNVGRTNLSGNLYPEFSSVNYDDTAIGTTTTLAITRPARLKNRFLADLEAEEKRDDKPGPRGDDVRIEDKYYDLDNDVTAWTDFLKVPFHPKSLFTCESLNSYGQMSRFDDGEILWKSGGVSEEFENRLRFFAEDSNCLQGFHLLCDIHDGVAGISSEVVQYIHDEFPRSAILAAIIFPGYLPLENASDVDQYVWNTANGLSTLTSHCTFMLPLSTAGSLWNRPSDQRLFTYLDYLATLPYHTSSIIASALESATTPWRRLLDFDRLPDVCDAMAFDGRKIGNLALALPLGINTSSDLASYFKNSSQQGTNYPISLTPHSKAGNDQLLKIPRIVSASLRGVKNMLRSRYPNAQPTCGIECRAASDLIGQNYRNEATSLSVNASYEPVYTKSPYPHIFSNTVGTDGMVTGSARIQHQGVGSTPAMTFMESSVQATGFLNSIIDQVQRLNWQKLKTDKDQIDTISNQLIDLTRPYVHHFEASM